MNAKDLIQKAWVLQVIVLILSCVVFAVVLSVEKFSVFLSALPSLTVLIGTQGVLAATGPEVKRFVEAKFGVKEETHE
jgi:hypothetical protein